ncbi:Hpt domain-containing protein [Paeniglutamicibacter cryotolerans]|uniref:HPt (Histidine-containing phosphotransfer) domain-containing protein n=1 Tax=Paeniglutamicibacter cryotolerans TaxID=670079 RepID=A0A839QH28_9MICC|nr:Hpt domain-containing protein [Paeniglutamicibacter cryotolerans]MBB2995200.1 HPt (histidine-containing phosphotransfer) domain-containing protein [Paeniglutamicibacter cryotolerans]
MSVVFAPGQQLVCSGTVHTLMVNVGTETTNLFLCRFISMLPARICKLEAAIRDHDGDAGLDAALSLKSSACMSGALRLGAVATALHLAFAHDDPAEQLALLEQVREIGPRTVRDLKRFLSGVWPTPS